jgi:hypothetical protein
MFLPMAPGVLSSPLVAADKEGAISKSTDAKTPYPQIVKTIPEQGATGVDPAL